MSSFLDAKDQKQLAENHITHILSIHDNAKPILEVSFFEDIVFSVMVDCFFINEKKLQFEVMFLFLKIGKSTMTVLSAIA